MINATHCLVVGLGLGLWLGFSVWLVSGYARVFMLLSVVVVTLPCQIL